MYTIPLNAVPVQTITVTMESIPYTLKLRDANGIMLIDISIAGTPIAQGVRCEGSQMLLPYEYLEGSGGNFFFSRTDSDEIYPAYKDFGTTCTLMYATAAEMAQARAAA